MKEKKRKNSNNNCNHCHITIKQYAKVCFLFIEQSCPVQYGGLVDESQAKAAPPAGHARKYNNTRTWITSEGTKVKITAFTGRPMKIWRWKSWTWRLNVSCSRMIDWKSFLGSPLRKTRGCDWGLVTSAVRRWINCDF